MKKIVFLLCLIFLTLAANGQQNKAYQPSYYDFNEESNYHYCLPWDYNEAAKEKYPLIVYLHGGGGLGDLAGLDFLGYSAQDQPQSEVAKEFQQQYPSFVMVPLSKRGWRGADLIPLIEDFKLKYPVDETRIYLIGYSMGGSGSYIIANAYYDYNQTLFAGIIRLAGQSQSELRDEIARNTSVWIHIGLNDEPQRVEISRKAYDYYKVKHPGSSELSNGFTVDNRKAITKSIVKKNSAIFNLTEYEDTGHEVYRFPFNNKELMTWLFSQKTE